ncbi:hypothetical protein AMK68_00405 [candidate division KD3-62 bacterium DG_56]|uniref:Uncharacterized protein n=1 Tax=candidate division KD3-62 bacterium DG_56 TaxID=1704032 RepID=A0A0S7XR53_9BACT|nr:MAG: hypothetical protein AMK68_00405 [candidate division KD3-62 bacterium DG_56]
MIGLVRRGLVPAVIAVTAGLLPAAAAEVYSVDLRAADSTTRLEVVSLQGLLARRPDGPQVVAIMRDSDWAAAGALLGADQEPSRLTPDQLIQTVKGKLAGQVIYDPDQPFTIGIATTLAGVHGGVLTARDLGVPTLEDLRGRFADRGQAYRWAVGALAQRCAAGKIALIDDGVAGPRDWAIRERAFVCDLDAAPGSEERDLLLRLLAASPLNTPVLGWPSARAGGAATAVSNLVTALAGRGDYLVPCGDAANLSVMAGGGEAPRGQRVHYIEPSDRPVVTFIMLGGERLDYALGRMRELWADSARGSIPLGWALSPSLFEYAPSAAVAYSVGARFGDDEWLVSPNGPGFTWLSAQAGLTKYLAGLEAAARRGDMTALVISDPGTAQQLGEVVSQLAGVTALQGVFALQGTEIASGVHNGFPVVAESVRARSVEQTVSDIQARLRDRQRLIAVGVEAGAMSPNDIASVIEELGDLVVIAQPSQFLRLFKVGVPMSRAGVKALKKTDEIAISDIKFDFGGAEQPSDSMPIEVSASVRSSEPILLAEAVYAGERDQMPFSITLREQGEGEQRRFLGRLPATLRGGELGVKIRAVDAKFRVAWSPVETLEVPMVDADDDGLSDTEEGYLRTDPSKADTDGDGLLDANDPQPRAHDQWVNYYLDPVLPPSDGPFVSADEGSTVGEDFRAVSGDGSWVYRLPLSGVPPGAPAAVAIVAEGAVVSTSPDGTTWTEIHRPEPADTSANLLVRELPTEWLAGAAVFVRIADAALDDDRPARVFEVSVTSPLEAPSVLMPVPAPAFPVLGITTRMSAKVYSPDGIAEVRLHYQINGGETYTIEITEVERSQVYAADLPDQPRLANGDVLLYWAEAKDKKDRVAVSARAAVPVGITRAETISLVAGGDFRGNWGPGGGYEGASSSAGAGAVDRAYIMELAQKAIYNVWLLAAPRGRAIAVEVNRQRVGQVPADARDGWTLLGRVSLARGKHQVKVTALDDTGDNPAGARATYAEVLLTADRGLKPPANLLLPYRNTFTIISPAEGAVLDGTATIQATAAGNVYYVEAFVGANRVRLGAQRTPPYSWRWRTTGIPNGEYVIRFRVLNRRDDDIFIPGIDRTVKVEN